MLVVSIIPRIACLLLFVGGIRAIDTNSGTKYVVKFYQSNIERESAKQFTRSYNDESHNGQFEILKIQQDEKSVDYMCFLPAEISKKESDEMASLSKIAEKQENLKKKVVNVLYNTFNRKECIFAYMLNELYWTYAYCFDDKVIQYHENLQHFIATGKHKADQPDFVFVLGRFSNGEKNSVEFENQSVGDKKLDTSDITISDEPLDSFLVTQRETNEYQAYASQTLTDGEMCDLTEKPRKINIVYKCDMNNRGRVEIVDVQEIKTCEYIMIVSVPRLCSIDEFIPVLPQDRPRHINCKLLKDASSEGVEPIFNAEDFFSDFEKIPSGIELFPSPDTYKLSMSDYFMMPCGWGFFLGTRKTAIRSSNLYYNYRHVLIYNGLSQDPEELLNEINKVMFHSIGRLILSPYFEGDFQTVLQWEDSFTLWFELYDFYGYFIKLVKITRDGQLPSKSLSIQLIDPRTMLDQEGDPVDIPVMEAPNNAWNFEHFSKHNLVAAVDAHTDRTSAHEVDSTDHVSEQIDEYETLASILGYHDPKDLKRKIEGSNMRVVGLAAPVHV